RHLHDPGRPPNRRRVLDLLGPGRRRGLEQRLLGVRYHALPHGKCRLRPELPRHGGHRELGEQQRRYVREPGREVSGTGHMDTTQSGNEGRSETEVKDAMKPSKSFGQLRAVSLMLAAGLLAVLAGDHTRGQSAGISEGIDPLDVLDLQVKPNVFIVLDSSGSMNETVFGNGMRGDHPYSKMFQAKQVLTDVIRDNEQKAAFMFGQYTQTANNFNNTGTRVNGTPNRFMYHTQSWDAVTGPPAFPVEGPGAFMVPTAQVINRLFAYQMIASAPTF